MKMLVWSDFACPFCYIGKVRLRRVLRDLGAERDVEVEFRSFELDPGACPEVVSTTQERFARKYGISSAEAAQQIARISRLGRGEGIDFRYASTNYTSMLDAHRLAKYGMAQGCPEIADRLFAAYFTDNLTLADRHVLAGIAQDAGLDGDEALSMLSTDAYIGDVRRDESDAARLGVRGVPYFYVEGRLSLPGCLPFPEMRSAIAGMLAQEKGVSVRGGRLCGPNGCHL